MIEGYTFNGVSYPSLAFARLTDAIFDGQSGVLKGSDIQIGSNQLIIGEGEFIIKGRHFRIVGDEKVALILPASGTLYCKLIAEIDLTKESSASNFEQVAFKTLTSAENYPSLTQQNINSGNAGENLYQYELAQFKLSSNGVSEFQDTRTFLEFSNIYAEIRKHIAEIDRESLFQMRPVILYENERGSNQDIELTDSSANYEYLEIFYKNLSHDMCNSVKVYNPNGKNVDLHSFQVYSHSGTIFGDSSNYRIEEGKLTRGYRDKNQDAYGSWRSWNNSITKENNIYITRILGYN